MRRFSCFLLTGVGFEDSLLFVTAISVKGSMLLVGRRGTIVLAWVVFIGMLGEFKVLDMLKRLLGGGGGGDLRNGGLSLINKEASLIL